MQANVAMPQDYSRLCNVKVFPVADSRSLPLFCLQAALSSEAPAGGRLMYPQSELKPDGSFHNFPVVLARLSITVTSSLISTGFATCASYPDRNARIRSSVLA
jgi:hypothetical protein